LESWEEFAVVTGGAAAAFTALAIAGGVIMFVLDRRAHRQQSRQRVAHILERISPNVLTMALIGLGGILTIFGVDWGLYLQVPAVIAALIGGVIGAWLFMMATGDSPAPDDNQQP